jgi:uncharacterized protein YjlB
MIRWQDFVQPEQLNFNDNGIFPNSPLPLLFYRDAITTNAKDPASICEQRFAENDWTNSWRDGVYSFPHYHSTSHEVLVFILALPLCDSVASMARTSRCMLAM